MSYIDKAVSPILSKFRDVYGDAFYECFVSMHRNNYGGEVRPLTLIRELLVFHKEKARKDFLVRVSVLNFKQSHSASSSDKKEAPVKSPGAVSSKLN